MSETPGAGSIGFSSLDGARFDALADALAVTGWAVCTGFLGPALARGLREEAIASWERDDFRRGGVGRGDDREVRSEIRTDHICWLDPGALEGAQADYWARMRELREALNRLLYLGLFELEAHLARFAPGGYYRPHLDRHSGTRARVLSAVVYLDEDWSPDDGGALRLYTDRSAGMAGPQLDVFPEAGKLALFLSGEIWHEVLPARRARHSVTGWFRRRSLDAS